MSTHKIAIIGGGNLGSAIALGLSTGKSNTAFGKITVTGRKMSKLEHLWEAGIEISTDNVKVTKESDIIILCVLPGQMEKALLKIKDVLDKKRHILVSTATGIKTSQISSIVGEGVAVVRAMPNTATAIKQSMTCICSENASDEQVKIVTEIFNAVGETIVIDEQLMQAATVLGASGIAFFLRFLRAATQGGIQMGFHPHEAQQIAVQTAIGASSLVKQNKNHPELEIDKVTTPRGCTIEGLNEMEHQGMSSAVIKGIMASYEKINIIS
ncbi:MAG: pyrroline-5-carboxylate reductase [Cyclobacteriaceae bacterium]|nr:pyrroline-5-carboxylate reductase [Cyclobacteriaceae bacterium]